MPEAVLAHADPLNAPPALTPLRLVTGWDVEPLPLAAVVATGAAYLWAAHRLRARGDSWPRGRSIAFVGLGLGLVVLATQSAFAAYDTVLVSVHMVQHMLLSMLAPIFLALGAPVTLALRTLRAAGRRALLRLLHSRVAAVLAFPAVAGGLYVVNPFVLYFTPLYDATLRHGWLHDLNHVHLLLVGCLWFWTVLGLDPLPSRLSHPARMIAVFATLPAHALLGVAVMSMTTLLAGDWYLAMARDWGPSPLADQNLAGGILWAAGDVVGLVVFAALFVQWARATEREAQREDRRLDRLEAERAAATRA